MRRRLRRVELVDMVLRDLNKRWNVDLTRACGTIRCDVVGVRLKCVEVPFDEVR